MSLSQEHLRRLKAFSETDFTEELKKFDVPTLVMHGEDDRVVSGAAFPWFWNWGREIWPTAWKP